MLAAIGQLVFMVVKIIAGTVLLLLTAMPAQLSEYKDEEAKEKVIGKRERFARVTLNVACISGILVGIGMVTFEWSRFWFSFFGIVVCVIGIFLAHYKIIPKPKFIKPDPVARFGAEKIFKYRLISGAVLIFAFLLEWSLAVAKIL